VGACEESARWWGVFRAEVFLPLLASVSFLFISFLFPLSFCVSLSVGDGTSGRLSRLRGNVPMTTYVGEKKLYPILL